MKKWKCNGCEQHHEIKSENHPQYCIDFGIANYHDWCEMNEEKLPKLTAEELQKRGIEWPEWADGAVVHSNESASFYCSEYIHIFCPYECKEDWFINTNGKFEKIPGKWDASDWKNSLIKRPEKQTVIPDWCKVGALCWNSQEGYGIVSETTFVAGVVNVKFFKEKEEISHIIDNLSEAHLYAWTHKTIPNLPFAVNLKFSSHFTDTITTCSLSGVWFARHSHEMVAFSALMDIAIMFDGSPCGKLTHKNENGEWVE